MNLYLTFSRASRVAAAIAVTAIAVAIPVAAQADELSGPQLWKNTANAAANDAIIAYVDEDYDGVADLLDIFDINRAKLVDDLEAKQSIADVLAAQAALDEAIAVGNAAQTALELANLNLGAAQAVLNGTPPTIVMPCFEIPGTGPCLPMIMPNPTYSTAQNNYNTALFNQQQAATANTTAQQDVAEAERVLAEVKTANPGVDVESLLAHYDNSAQASEAAAGALEDADYLLQRTAYYVGIAADLRGFLDSKTEAENAIVWALEDGSNKVSAGDTVTVAFSVANTYSYDLSAASVSVTSPVGIEPECDIAEGLLAADASATCTFEYTVTAADAEAGKAEFAVSLEGYLPFGSGNPQVRAVNKTLVLVSSTLSLTVTPTAVDADLPVAVTGEAPASVDTAAPTAVATGELAETGANLGWLGMSAALTLVGAGLVVASRRRSVQVL